MRRKLLLHVFIPIQILICSIQSSAQIIYTDFFPDIYLTNQPTNTTDSAYIDVDQDSLIDFTIQCSSFLDGNNLYNSDNHIRIIPAQLSFSFDSSPISQSVCGRINLGYNQFVGSNFSYPQSYIYAWFYRSGPIASCGYGLDTSAKYYPFAKFVNNDTLFGWIQISATPNSMTIYDLAINLTPNTGFYTGQLSSIANNYQSKLFNIYPNPSSSSINFRNNYNDIINFELFDIAGKSLLQRRLNSQAGSIDIFQFDNGIYYYTIYDKNKLILKQDILIKND
jgi:hypothetical protein